MRPPGDSADTHGMSECEQCGATASGVEVLCKFCKKPLSAELLSSAVECPRCHTPNRPERTDCTQCHGSLLIACIFCGHGSTLGSQACQSCGEQFAGAEQRMSDRKTEQLMGAVGNVMSALTGTVLPGLTGEKREPEVHRSEPRRSRDDDGGDPPKMED